jgi:hypothetical protein
MGKWGFEALETVALAIAERGRQRTSAPLEKAPLAADLQNWPQTLAKLSAENGSKLLISREN